MHYVDLLTLLLDKIILKSHLKQKINSLKLRSRVLLLLTTKATFRYKQQPMEEYYKSKSSAPVFEGFAGVPLSSFSSTAPIQNQNDRLRAWAEKNPNNPKSKHVLEQLKGG